VYYAELSKRASSAGTIGGQTPAIFDAGRHAGFYFALFTKVIIT
jgi:hypothetical protein